MHWAQHGGELDEAECIDLEPHASASLSYKL